EKAGGDLDDVEANLLGLLQILVDSIRTVAQYGFDPAARGDVGVVLVSQVAESAHLLARHQGERAARPLDAVDPLAGDIEHIGQMPRAIGGIIWAADFGQPDFARLLGAIRPRDKIEAGIGHDDTSLCVAIRLLRAQSVAAAPRRLVHGTWASSAVSSLTDLDSSRCTTSAIRSRCAAPVKGITSALNFAKAPSQSSGLLWKPR